jgi:hypothetical protein
MVVLGGQRVETCFRIIEPFDFNKVIEVIRDNLKNGTLKHSNYWPEGQVFFKMPPFEEEDWGDSVLYYFECSTCGQLFELSVEMYHGRGGRWQPISQESRKL